MTLLENPMAAQEACLRRVLKRCKDTAYGRDHGFSEIQSIDEFQQKVPLITYENMTPYIARCVQGEENVLFPDKILYYMATSGTTGNRKLFPLGEYRVRVYARETTRRGLFYIVHGDHYDLLDGATLVLHAPPTSEVTIGSIDVAAATGAFSSAIASLPQSQGSLFRGQEGLMIPPREVNAITDWEEKLYLTARYAAAADVRMTVGVTSLVVGLLRKMSNEFYNRLLADPELDEETKTKLRRVSKDGVINLKQLWPNFTIFGAGGTSITPHRRIIHELLGDIEIWDVYGATEATMGAQIYPDRGIVLAIDRTFFEFLAVEEEGAEPITLADVKINTPYEVIITNHAGFYRYRMGDLVTFACLDPPELKEITRMKTLVNVVGERTREEMLLQALEHACQRQSTSFVDFTLLPEVTTQIARYHLFIEFTQVPDNLEEFSSDVDSHLIDAGMYYKFHRENGVLSPPVIVPVKPGGFKVLLQKLGKDPLHGKVPRVLTTEISGLIPRLKLAT
jgi:hypothetical protein